MREGGGMQQATGSRFRVATLTLAAILVTLTGQAAAQVPAAVPSAATGPIVADAAAHAAGPAGAEAVAAYVDAALQSNQSLQAREAAWEAAGAALDQARAAWWPRLSLSARYTRASGGRTLEFPVGDLLNPVYATLNALTANSPNPTQFPQIDNQSIALLREREQDTRLSLTTPLFAPAIGASVAARGALLRSEGARREAFARTLVRDVQQACYAYAQAQAGVEALEASERSLQENLRVNQALLDAGKATRDRTLRAQAELLAVQQRLAEARDDRAQAGRYVNFLANRDPDAPVQIAAADVAVIAPAAPAIARPELLQVEAAAQAADHGARAVRAEYLPTLSLAADYGMQGEEYRFDSESDFSTVSLVLSWTLFDGGSRRARRAQAQLDHERLVAERDYLERQLELARRGAQDDARTAASSLQTAAARLEAASEVFRIAERKRDAGALSQIEFLDAERTLTEARLGLSVARSKYLSSVAELQLATVSYPLPERLRADSAARE